MPDDASPAVAAERGLRPDWTALARWALLFVVAVVVLALLGVPGMLAVLLVVLFLSPAIVGGGGWMLLRLKRLRREARRTVRANGPYESAGPETTLRRASRFRTPEQRFAFVISGWLAADFLVFWGLFVTVRLLPETAEVPRALFLGSLTLAGVLVILAPVALARLAFERPIVEGEAEALETRTGAWDRIRFAHVLNDVTLAAYAVALLVVLLLYATGVVRA